MYFTGPRAFTTTYSPKVVWPTVKSNLIRIAKTIWSNLGLRRANKELYKNARAKLLEGLKEWDKRIQGKKFHGGEDPDEADFEMYALIKSKYNSRSFRRLIENESADKFYRWFVRMQVKCAYDPERIMVIA